MVTANLMSNQLTNQLLSILYRSPNYMGGFLGVLSHLFNLGTCEIVSQYDYIILSISWGPLTSTFVPFHPFLASLFWEQRRG